MGKDKHVGEKALSYPGAVAPPVILPGLGVAASAPLAWLVSELPSAHAGSAWRSVPPLCKFLAGENERDFLSDMQQAWAWRALPLGWSCLSAECPWADSRAAAWPEASLTFVLAGALTATGYS